MVIKKTPLHDVHQKLGARIIEFVGWRMPVQYSSVIEEHLAVRQQAGIFDVSHMGEIFIAGKDALSFIQKMTCNDASKLSTGKIQYSALMYPQGTIVDDILIYRIGEDEFMMCVNAANTEKDFDWIKGHVEGDVQIDNRSLEYAQIALQGPRSQEILSPCVNIDLSKLGYYRFQRGTVDNVPGIISRTGYTGEDGFELYLPSDAAISIWDLLMEKGATKGLKPAGLAARDTLRLEAKMMLYGNDIDETTTVLEADLDFILKLDKGDFIGREPLSKQAKEGVARKLVGFEMVGKGIARHGYPVYHQGKEVGLVNSGSYAPYLKKNIGLTYLPVEIAEIDKEFDVEIRGKSSRATVVPTPFYKRKK
jgi:aminomethyltransferase